MSFHGNIYAGAFIFASGVILAALGFFLLEWKRRRTLQAQTRQARDVLERAQTEAEQLRREARLTAAEEAQRNREQAEAGFGARRQELAALEKRLGERDTTLNAQFDEIIQAEKRLREERAALARQTDELAAKDRELARLIAERKEQLAAVARLSETEARTQFLREVEQEASGAANDLSRQIVEDARARAEEKARQIISVTIQRYAGEHTSEVTTATVALPGDEMKGRIIGRDGRNIRAFEAATGVTVLIDDTPNAVVLSGFDPVRREIAREAMARLIADGRIHPTRIEEVVAKVNQEMDETIGQLGDAAVHKAGVALPQPEIVALLGRLHFRQSYSQNVLNHSVEVAHLMGLMAAELGISVELAKRSGLLHDIGKAVSHEVEGPHAVAGAEILKRNGEPAAVVNAVASHHNDVPPEGPLGILVSAADAISASRPGARAENMAVYIKRIEDLEKLALGFEGVEKCFAAQAGRELRVFVQPEKITDEQAFVLARKIAGKVEEELQYPGQIKITVIRETRCIEVAK